MATVNVTSSSASTGKVIPTLEGYQIMGASQMRRLATSILKYKPTVHDGQARVGLCIGGQRTDDLLSRIKSGNSIIAEKALLHIGTNDILKEKPPKEIQDDFILLLGELLKRAKEVVVLTILPIPAIAENEQQSKCVNELNVFLGDLCNIMNEDSAKKIRLIDIHSLFTKEGTFIRMDCFHKTHRSGDIDLVHLNEKGLAILHKYLIKKL